MKRLVAAVLAVPALMLASAGAAEASALGYQVFRTKCVKIAGKDVCFPGGTLGHYIKGDKNVIVRQEASVDDNFGGGTSGGQFCNWRIDWAYLNTSNVEYSRSYGTTRFVCEGWSVIGRVDTVRRNLQYGKACAVLIAGGSEIARQCHYITA